MKAPDKIYIQTNAGETLSSKWTTVPFRDFENTEYIRSDSLPVEQPDIDKIKREWYNKGYLKGRKESNIPARELGLPKSYDMQEQQKVDLEDELDKFYKELDFGPSEAIEYETHKQIARHFYELGLNARKEE